MQERTAATIAGLVCAAICATITAVVVLDRRLADAGRPDLELFGIEAIPFIAATVSASAVGAILAVRRPAHPVGWLFLALGGTIPLSGLLDGYGWYGTLARPDSVPAAELSAVLGDSSFIAWFVLVAMILHLTPTGRPLSRRWGAVAAATVVAAGLWALTALLWPEPLDPPLDEVRSPLALPDALIGPMRVVRTGLGFLTGLGLIAAGISLLVRFRRSVGVERRRLLWLAVVVVPLPVYVVVSYAASPNHPLLLAVATSGFLCLIPIATGLSIARYHLYDVEQVLSRAVTYLLVSGVLAVTFITVVVSTGRVIGDQGGDAQLPAVLGTLAAAVAAIPVYRAFQEAVDRRFNRRRFDAVRIVRDHVRDPVRSPSRPSCERPSPIRACARRTGSRSVASGSPRTVDGSGPNPTKSRYAGTTRRSRASRTTSSWSTVTWQQPPSPKPHRNSRAPACGRRSPFSSPTYAHRVVGSPPPSSANAVVSSVTSTTAPSNGCSPSRCSSGRPR